jgi:hypothetical protein
VTTAAGNDDVAAALRRLVVLDGVTEAIDRARDACTELRWHPALRRRAPQARTESLVRAVRSSAALDGARLPVDLVRAALADPVVLPDDATGRVVRGALRAGAELERIGTMLAGSPLRALARLHVLAAAGLVDADHLGRPRGPGERALDAPGVAGGAALDERLATFASLVAAPPDVPALLVAAVSHAEILAVRPFAAGNGVVARAVARAVVVERGLDPTGVVVWEAGHLADAAAYAAALEGYAAGGAEGVRRWLLVSAGAVVRGVDEGRAVADAVLAGHLPT